MKFDFEKEAFVNGLQEMVQDYGRMILNDDKKCYSLWLDYAPQLSEEGELLKVFLELGLGKQAVELKKNNAEERAAWKKQAIENMVRAGQLQKDAECLVEAVLAALGWGEKQSQPAQVAPIEVRMEPKPQPTSLETPKEQSSDAKAAVEAPIPEHIPLFKALGRSKRFGPEEIVECLNIHLPKIKGFGVYIIPNNRTNWREVGKYTAMFPRGFENVHAYLLKLGIPSADIVLGIVTEESMRGGLKRALVFSATGLYQIYSGHSWVIAYDYIERVELQDDCIVLWERSGSRKVVQPFRYDFNTKEILTLIQTLVKRVRLGHDHIYPNSQKIESPKKMFSAPYYVRAKNIKPGDCILCRTSSNGAAPDNYMKECTYISQAHSVKALGGDSYMLYVKIAQDCYGWVPAAVMEKEFENKR